MKILWFAWKWNCMQNLFWYNRGTWKLRNGLLLFKQMISYSSLIPKYYVRFLIFRFTCESTLARNHFSASSAPKSSLNPGTLLRMNEFTLAKSHMNASTVGNVSPSPPLRKATWWLISTSSCCPYQPAANPLFLKKFSFLSKQYFFKPSQWTDSELGLLEATRFILF